ncbi:MAG: CRP/FNR family transcriptional regulator [Saprospiraceae bacterium]|jgi:CRP/FNR family transcriptional regulator
MKNLRDSQYGKLFEEQLLSEIVDCGVFKTVEKGELLIDIGSYIKHMPLLLEGAIKIIRVDQEGNELLLYFLEKGDTCAMTMTCCMGQSQSEIRAIAENDTKLILLPVQKMEEWLKYKSWRDFVFASYNGRLYEMLDAIDTLAFMNMDNRLLKYLRNKVIISKNKMLHVSHQDIAHDLNTSRVVISRLLKRFEQESKIKIHRNRLEILEH